MHRCRNKSKYLDRFISKEVEIILTDLSELSGQLIEISSISDIFKGTAMYYLKVNDNYIPVFKTNIKAIHTRSAI